jgi:hypothetical protein
MEQKKCFEMKGDFKSVDDEINQAKIFLMEARNFFEKKKKGNSASKKVFTEQMYFIIKSRINEIEKIVSMQKIDIDTFALYKLRKSMQGLKEKINYINSLEKL